MKRNISLLTIVMLIVSAVLMPPNEAYGADASLTKDWERSFGYLNEGTLSQHTAPVIDRAGNIYAVDAAGYMYCIGSNMELKYMVNINQTEAGGGYPVTDSNLNAYMGSGDGYVYSFDINGSLRWKYRMEGKASVAASGVLSPDESTVYMADRDTRVYAIDTSSGELIWRSGPRLGTNCTTPVLTEDGSMLYVASNSHMIAFDTVSSGEQRLQSWMTRTAYEDENNPPVFNSYDSMSTVVSFTSIPAVDGEGSVYAASWTTDNRYYLSKFSKEGTELWQIDLGLNKEPTSPRYYEGYIYYAIDDGSVYRVSASTAAPEPELLAKVDNEAMADRTWSPVSISDEGLLYAYIGNNIYVLDLKDPDAGIVRRSTGGCNTIMRMSDITPSGELYVLYRENNGSFMRKMAKYVDMSVELNIGSVSFPDEAFTMRPGSTWDILPDIRDSKGNIINRALSISYESSDESVASFDGSVLTALSPGKSVLTVRVQDMRAEAELEVTDSLDGAVMTIRNTDTAIMQGEKLALDAELSLGAVPLRGEKISYRSYHTDIATVSDKGMVTGVKEGIAKLEAYADSSPDISAQIPVTVDQNIISAVTADEVSTALTKSMDYLSARSLNDWDAFSVNAAGIDLNAMWPAYVQGIKDSIKSAGGSAGGQMTDYERTAIGLISAGQDVTRFVYDEDTGAYVDFIAEIHRGAAGGLGQGINAAIWGLVALNAADYNESDYAGSEYLINKEYLIEYILNNKSGDGWAFGGGGSADPDMTGMGLYALAPYRDRPDVREAGEKAFQWLSDNQLPSGRFGSWGTVNSCSTSQVLMGLLSWGIDPQTDTRFIKPNGNAMTAMMSYYLGDGTFAYTDGYDAAFGTRQGIQALAAMNSFFESGRSDIWENIVYSGDVRPDIRYITIRPGNVIIPEGSKIETAAVTDKGAAIESQYLTWESKTPEILKVDGGAVEALAAGEGYVAVTYRRDDAVLTAEIKVTVEKAGQLLLSRESSHIGVPAGSSTHTYTVTNNSDQAAEVILIGNVLRAEDYTGGRELMTMERQMYVALSIEAGESETVTMSFDIPSDGSYDLQIMLWDSMGAARARSSAITVKEVK